MPSRTPDSFSFSLTSSVNSTNSSRWRDLTFKTYIESFAEKRRLFFAGSLALQQRPTRWQHRRSKRDLNHVAGKIRQHRDLKRRNRRRVRQYRVPRPTTKKNDYRSNPPRR